MHCVVNFYAYILQSLSNILLVRLIVWDGGINWSERRRYQVEAYQPKPFNSNDEDSEAQRDRARLIHSSAFRRLQSKTQVLGIGESDFYRTRLTHSLEVAQIGSGICERLRESFYGEKEFVKWVPSLSQIEAIGLAHDIGHPPFGHGGEIALNYYMYNKGGFEGNGQTLRIVSKLGEYSPFCGLDLTRRTMLGLLKYPTLHKEVANYNTDDLSNLSKTNIEALKPPKCIHDDEEDILKWILDGIPEEDVSEFFLLEESEGKLKTKYKAFDTTIMELADDIAYGVHDLEDALALKLVEEKKWDEKVMDNLSENSALSKDLDFYRKKLFSDSNKDRKHAISKLIRYFMSQITIIKQNKFVTPLLDLKAIMSDEARETLCTLKEFVFSYIIKSPEVQVLEYKGQQMILRLFEVLKDNPQRLLPVSTYKKYSESNNPNRIISDYISGMTDNYAAKLYHKLFSPNMGSIFDRL